jgi:hypothetical protein
MTETCVATPRAGAGYELRPHAEEAKFSLPSGWTLFRRQGPARTSIEIHDAQGDMVGLVASTTRLPIATVDAGWRGFERTPDGGRSWWALAIGHGWSTPAGVVTFTRRLSPGRVRRQVVSPVIVDGLWVAAAAGRYTAVTFRQGANEDARRLRPVNSWQSTPVMAGPNDVTREDTCPT